MYKTFRYVMCPAEENLTTLFSTTEQRSFSYVHIHMCVYMAGYICIYIKCLCMVCMHVYVYTVVGICLSIDM